ncbi:hypothetical protein PIB30_069401 [Stylosanthes scabra]|uniref:Uncharacterized protein n=1 Tax=Stylosanthes scabra TaxID=79078 RepID=A0ABU6TQC9_9FABA|nr:hypothetical protein [Stylosanthes scabra]
MLPSLGQIPFLKHLRISDLVGLPSIGAEFYKNGESCWEAPFPSLETLHFNRVSFWKEWHSTERNAFPLLKELNMSDCSLLAGDLPDHLPSLEKLTVIGCKQLACSLPRAPMLSQLSILGSEKVRMQELPLSLCSLQVGGSDLVESVMEAISHSGPNCLRNLAISKCSSAVSFPGACMLASLLTLEITDCKRIDSQCNKHRCFSLNSLFFNHLGCASLMSFSTLPQLQLLTIERCPEIDSFPDSLPPKLRQLCIRNCKKLVRFLATMDIHSHSLIHLHIEGACESVKSFPNENFLLPSLKSLYLQGFTSLETLDCKGLSRFASLRKLTISDCPKLENMEGGKLPISLIQLTISESPLLGRRCEMKDSQIWPKISHIHCIKVDQRRIW